MYLYMRMCKWMIVIITVLHAAEAAGIFLYNEFVVGSSEAKKSDSVCERGADSDPESHHHSSQDFRSSINKRNVSHSNSRSRHIRSRHGHLRNSEKNRSGSRMKRVLSFSLSHTHTLSLSLILMLSFSLKATICVCLSIRFLELIISLTD